MKKLSYSIMDDAINNKNLENFKEILPYFYYDDTTNNRIIKELSRKRMLHRFLELDSQKRIWFEVPNTSDFDMGYKKYKEYLKSNYLDKLNLLHYSTYRNGYVLDDNGQKIKLFKFLLKNNFLTDSQVDEINSIRNRKNNLYFCISRNPIDYLFCSTNQSFSSCEALNSKTDACYYMALPAMTLDPNRFLLFVATPELYSYKLKGKEFFHFKYITRSWGLYFKNNTVIIIRYYPSKTIDLKELLNIFVKNENISNIIDLHTTNIYDINTVIESKWKFNIPKYTNNQNALMYLDYVGICINNNKGIYNLRKGHTGGITIFYHSNGFESIKSFKNLLGIYSCTKCNSEIHKGSVYSVDGEDLCSECFYKEYFRCYICNTSQKREEIGEKYNCGYICKSCASKYKYRCTNCKNVFYRNYKIACDFPATAQTVCDNCIDIVYKYCNFCKKFHNAEMITTIPRYTYKDDYIFGVCNKCQKHIVICTECKERHHVNNIKVLGESKKEGICRYCYVPGMEYISGELSF